MPEATIVVGEEIYFPRCFVPGEALFLAFVASIAGVLACAFASAW